MDFTNTELSTNTDTRYLNVNGCNDPHYRYKMAPIDIKTISKNGGTTALVNALQITQDIYRELPDLKSCFSKALGCKVTIVNDQLYIAGRHSVNALQDLLHTYIINNVLCPRCKNPETTGKNNKRKCQACGYKL